MESSSLVHATIYFALQSHPQKVRANLLPSRQVSRRSARAQAKHRQVSLRRRVKMWSPSTTEERCAPASGPAISIAERGSKRESPRESTTSASLPAGSIAIPTKRRVKMWTLSYFAARKGRASGPATPGATYLQKTNKGRRSAIIAESGVRCVERAMYPSFPLLVINKCKYSCEQERRKSDFLAL